MLKDLDDDLYNNIKVGEYKPFTPKTCNRPAM